MPIITQLEDISNEIFLIICEYLHANDIFLAFASLNSRISLLLKLVPLHVNIPSTYSRHELEFLSNHLKSHSSQVVSLQSHDEIYYQTDVIAYLFHQHNFINLRSCIFHSIHSSSQLTIVFEKLSKLDQIVVFRIIQSCNAKEDKLNQYDASKFSQLILTETRQSLRSASLYFHYNHPQMTITNLIHLQIIFYGKLNDISIYSLIPLLRVHRVLRTLCVTIKSTAEPRPQNLNVPDIPFINENNLPISSLLKFFDLQIVMVPCDIYSISVILRCMPNLYQFAFTLIGEINMARFSIDLTDGESWREILTTYVPYLKKFDFHISLLKPGRPMNLDDIANSFKCLVNLYHDWNMCVSRWKYWPNLAYFQFEHLHMWTVNYHHLMTRRETDMESILMSNTFNMRSTNISNLNVRQCNYHHHKMDFYMPRESEGLPIQLPTILPFQNITYIVCNLAYPEPMAIAYILNFGIRLKRILSLYTIDDDDSKQYFENLSRLVNLNNVNTVQFSRNYDITRLHLIEHVLPTCPNVTTLILNSSLLFSTKVLDNPALFLIFQQINKIRILVDDMDIPSKDVSRFVQRFQSLTIVEMEVDSINILIPIIDILLNRLTKLRFIVIRFEHGYRLNKFFSRKYIIEKRSRSLGLSKENEAKIVAKLEDKTLSIRIL